jgi:acetoacetyl-CoA synthetase
VTLVRPLLPPNSLNTHEQPLWQPSAAAIERSHLDRFRHFVNVRHHLAFATYDELHEWSTSDLPAFWQAVRDYSCIKMHGGERTLDDRGMPGSRFFVGATLNYAENLLDSAWAGELEGSADAIVFWSEDRVRRRVSRDGLKASVSRLAQAMAQQGIGKGDRVAGFLPNIPEAIVAMLAAASLGAVWTSCSPDFAVDAVVDRFGQVEPLVMFVTDSYLQQGRRIDLSERLRELSDRLPSVRQWVVIPQTEEWLDLTALVNATLWGDYIEPHDAQAIRYTPVAFSDPLFILYSSGTTGAPKCIVHSVGGTLITHMKEHLLHADIHAGDRLFYFTTCGWMMWNWQVSALAVGATLAIFNGSPFVGRGNVLFDYAAAEHITHFGASAKYFDALAKLRLQPRQSHSLKPLRVVLSTGSPLAPETFDYIYVDIKADVQLASISGGTDIVACFVGGIPTRPVWRGEIQGPLLGMKVEVFNDVGQSVWGEKGELVCTAPFPSMPLGFWGDDGFTGNNGIHAEAPVSQSGAPGTKYHRAYFKRYPGVWCHGDYAEVTVAGGLVIYGRSDTVLNPGGVRIGTAEIYRQVEQLPEVEESIVIGQNWPPERPTDIRIVLFVKLAEGAVLDEALVKRIKDQIRLNTTPRHVPDRILAVPDIPRTKSGKIVELAVKQVVEGETVKNLSALANPEALAHFRGRL